MAAAAYRENPYGAYPPARRPMQVYDIPQEREPARRPIPPKKKKKAQGLGIGVLLGLVVIVLLFAKISRLSVKTANAKKIDSLSKQVNDLQIENDTLAVNLAQEKDISQVEQVARNDLNMQYPSGEQYRYVDIPTLPQEQPETEAAFATENGGFWGAISSLFNN